MKTRIQITIIDEDRDKLFDRQQEIMFSLEDLPFPFLVDIFDNEPEVEPEIEILYPS
jgi:hypothetical protein